MKLRILILPLLLISVAGCAQIKSAINAIPALTTTVQNPVGPSQLSDIENAYVIAAKAVLTYRALGQCRASQQATFTNPCYRHSVFLQVQAANRKAYNAIVAARNFVRNNPTLNAATAISAALTALKDFQNVSFINGIGK